MSLDQLRPADRVTLYAIASFHGKGATPEEVAKKVNEALIEAGLDLKYRVNVDDVLLSVGRLARYGLVIIKSCRNVANYRVTEEGHLLALEIERAAWATTTHS